MRYFTYCTKAKSVTLTCDIFNAVQALSSYAKTVYKNRWEEALDNAYFHILNNYNEESGDLQHYAIRVVGTILLGKYSKEVPHDIALTTGMESKSLREGKQDLAEGYIEDLDCMSRNNFNECLKMMVPKFLNDFTLFQTGNTQKRKEDYSEIFKQFELETIADVKEYLMRQYEGTMLRLKETASECKLRKISPLRYDKSLDDSIDFKRIISDIVIYKRRRNQHVKMFYMVDLKEIVPRVVEQMYYENKDFFNYTDIEGQEVYVSLSGDIIVGIKQLFDVIEYEILSALVRNVISLRVVKYEKGCSLLLSSSKEICEIYELTAFGVTVSFPLERKPSKRYQ